MALVARGLTNGEIAERLDMTLDGAKWNVSEILTKLGLSTREEVAAYWQWRQQPRSRIARLARGAFPALGWKWLAGGATAAVATGGVIAGMLLFQSSGEPNGPGGAFALEADIVVTSAVEGDVESRLTWQWRDARHYRYTIDQVSDAAPGGMRFETVADGEWQWHIQSGEPAYYREELPPTDPDAPAWLPMSLLIGPSNEATIDDFLRYLRRLVDEPGADSFADVVGEEEALGRKVTVIEFGPTWTSSSAVGNSQEVTEHGGSGRLWVDPVSMFILRYEVDSNEQTVLAVVTRLDRSPGFEPGDFMFEPPAGTVLDDRTTEDVARGEEVLFTDATLNPAWPGYYAIMSLPPGYAGAEWQRNGTPASFMTGFRPLNGCTSKELEACDYVRVFQAPTGRPPTVVTETHTAALTNGITVTLGRGGGLTYLWWDDGETFVEISTNAMPEGALIEFASSFQKQPALP